MRVVMVSVIFLLVGVLAASPASKVRGRARFRAFADAIAGMRVIPTRWAGWVGSTAMCWATAGGSVSPAGVDAPRLLAAVAAAGVAVAAMVRLDDLLRLVRGVSPTS